MPISLDNIKAYVWLVVFIGASGFVTSCVDLDQKRPSETNLNPPSTEVDSKAPSSPGTTDAGSSDTARPSSDTESDWNWDTEETRTGGDLELERVIPSMAPKTGGTKVRVTGSGLGSVTKLFIGEREVEFERPEFDYLLVRMPKFEKRGRFDIRAVVDEDSESAVLEDTFRVVEPLKVDDVEPQKLSSNGDERIHLYGTGFHKKMGIRFRTKAARKISIVNSNHLIVEAPPLEPGAADLHLTTPYRTMHRPDFLDIQPPLSVEHVIPASGLVSGRNIVEVRGEGFSSKTTFWFGNSKAKRVGTSGGGRIKVRLPEMTEAKPVDIEAIENDHSAELEKGYYFTDTDETRLVSVQPQTGLASPETSIYLRGANLDVSGLSVFFGDKQADILNQNASYIEVRPPHGQAGPVDVIVESNQGRVARLPDSFEYVEKPVIKSVSPSSMKVEEEERIQISGQHLGGVDEVRIGARSVDMLSNEATAIEVAAEEHAVGAKDVVLKKGRFSIVEKNAIRFVQPFELWNFRPIEGSVAGDTFVEVLGEGLINLESFKIEETQLESRVVFDDYRAGFYTPSHPVGYVNLSMGLEDEVIEFPHGFRFYDPMLPEGGVGGGPIRGAVNVTALTQGGRPLPGALVLLSNQFIDGYYGTTDDSGQLTISEPGLDGAQSVTVTAKGYSAVTFQDVNARDLTVFLQKLESSSGDGQMPPPVPKAEIAGEVKRTAKADISRNEKEGSPMVMVRTTRAGIYRPSSISPGDSSLLLGNKHYSIDTRVGDLALIALCGVYRQSEDRFVPGSMGVKRHLTIQDGEKQHKDIECDIPLKGETTFKFPNPIYSPGGPNINRVRLFLDLGTDGVFQWPVLAKGVGAQIELSNLPRDRGKLSDMDYAFIAGSYTRDGMIPYSRIRRTRIDRLSSRLVVPRLLDIPERRSNVVRTPNSNLVNFELKGPVNPDFTMGALQTIEGKIFWRIFAPGTARQFRLPNFKTAPEGFEPYRSSNPYIAIAGVQGSEIHYNRFKYRYLEMAQWDAISRANWKVQIE